MKKRKYNRRRRKQKGVGYDMGDFLSDNFLKLFPQNGGSIRYKKKKQRGKGYLGQDKWSKWFTAKNKQLWRGAWGDLKLLPKTLAPIKSNFGY